MICWNDILFSEQFSPSNNSIRTIQPEVILHNRPDPIGTTDRKSPAMKEKSVFYTDFPPNGMFF